MPLDQVHILLTYTCNFACDHCFVYSGPDAAGTMTIGQVHRLLDQAVDVGSVEWIYFEGGEAFLRYPVMVAGVRAARDRGFRVGIVTNAYWADSADDARLWLEPLAGLVDDLSVSDDAFHYGDAAETPARVAMAIAADLGIRTAAIAIDPPTAGGEAGPRGRPVIGGGVRFRGRAVDQLVADLPRRPWESLAECPYEELAAPTRVHVDPYGHVQVCQGLSIGNVWETPLAEIMASHDAAAHPICGPLLRGGPADLAREHDTAPENGFVDECHLCFTTRRELLDRFPAELAPRQVYGTA